MSHFPSTQGGGEQEKKNPDSSPDTSLRERMTKHSQEWVHKGATHLIKIGRDLPWLRKLGYQAYDLATRPFLHGREVKRLGSVGDNVWRGSQPSDEAFETLLAQGVETVINLRPESDRERAVLQKLGLRYIYLPLPPLGPPTHELTLAFLDAVTNPHHGVVFFHCYHGVDRTGAMAACLRIARDAWSVEAAVSEMREFGVHEHGQRSKIEYIQKFFEYWHTLPLNERCRWLHRPIPAEPEESTPQGWWQRARAKVRAWFSRLTGAAPNTLERRIPPAPSVLPEPSKSSADEPDR
ncbi:MAG: hypothetical protein VKN33_09170 [Candidatus Sericytochromatia bacterium]|nr:hypothetical protein [Candidatus Sericytochromatia bacterium]